MKKNTKKNLLKRIVMAGLVCGNILAYGNPVLASPSMRMIIQGKGITFTSGTVSLSANEDLSVWSTDEQTYNDGHPGDPLLQGLGIFTREDVSTPRTTTIQGSYTITSSGYDGLTVNAGDTLGLKYMTFSGFSTAITNNGTLNIEDVKFSGTTTADIVNNGTLNLSGVRPTLIKGITGTGTIEASNGLNIPTTAVLEQANVTISSSSGSRKVVYFYDVSTINVSEKLTFGNSAEVWFGGSSKVFSIDGDVVNNGEVKVTSGNPSITVKNGSTWTNNRTFSGSQIQGIPVTVAEGGTLINNTDFVITANVTNNGTLINSGRLATASGAKFTNNDSGEATLSNDFSGDATTKYYNTGIINLETGAVAGAIADATTSPTGAKGILNIKGNATAKKAIFQKYVTVDEGKTLTFEGGSITMNGGEFTNNGSVYVKTAATIKGGSFTCNGNITFATSQVLTVTIPNGSSLTVAEGAKIGNTGTPTRGSAAITIESGGSFENKGTIDGYLINKGTVTSVGYLLGSISDNSGTLTATNGSVADLGTNSGTLTLGLDILTNVRTASGASWTNTGNLTLTAQDKTKTYNIPIAQIGGYTGNLILDVNVKQNNKIINQNSITVNSGTTFTIDNGQYISSCNELKNYGTIEAGTSDKLTSSTSMSIYNAGIINAPNALVNMGTKTLDNSGKSATGDAVSATLKFIQMPQKIVMSTGTADDVANTLVLTGTGSSYGTLDYRGAYDTVKKTFDVPDMDVIFDLNTLAADKITAQTIKFNQATGVSQYSYFKLADDVHIVFNGDPDKELFDGPNRTKTFKLFDGTVQQLKVSEETITIDSGTYAGQKYTYTISCGGTIPAGTIVVQRVVPISLRMLVQGKDPEDSTDVWDTTETTLKADLDLSTYLAAEEEYNTNHPSSPVSKAIGTLARQNASTPRSLTINGGTYKITSNGYDGLTIENEGDSVTVVGGTWSGFDTAITNSGTLTLNGVTFADTTTADVDNDGILNIVTAAPTFCKGITGEGTTNFNINMDMGSLAITQNKVVIASGKTLTMGADLNAAVDNSGTLAIAATNLKGAVDNKIAAANVNLSAGTLGNHIISGLGTVTLKGAVTANASSLAVTHTNGVQIGSYTLTLKGGTLGAKITGTGPVVIGDGTNEETVSATLAQFANTGTLSVAANGNLELTGAGTLSKVITNGGAVTLNPGTGNTFTVSSTGSISGGTLNISGLVVYSGSSAIGAATVIKSGGKLDPAPEKLNASTTVESGGELYLDGGTLSVDIAGSGTTYLLSSPTSGSASTVTVNSTRSIVGTLNGSGGTVNMVGGTGDNLYTTLSVGDLAGTTNLKIDLDMGNVTKLDSLVIGAVNTAGTVLNLSEINITADYNPGSAGELTLSTEVENGITYVAQSGGYNSSNLTYKLNGGTGSYQKAGVVTNRYIYTFSLGDAGKLDYKITAATTNTVFADFIKGNLPGVPQTLTLTDDLADGGANMSYNVSFDTLNINVGDGKKLGAATGNTVVLQNGDTINLKGGKTTAGIVNTGWSVGSGGALNLSKKLTVNGAISNSGINGITVADAVTLSGAVSSSGSLKIDGGILTVNASITQSGITLTGADDKLIINADNLKISGGISNSGIVELTGGTLTSSTPVTYNTISGTGNIVIAGNVTSNAARLAEAVTINNGNTLTLNGGNLAGNISVATTGDKDGALKIAGTVTNTDGKDVNVKALTINSSCTLTTALNKLTVTDANITNDGILILTGKEASAASVLANNVVNGSGTGKVQIGDGSTDTDISTSKNINNDLYVKSKGKLTTTGAVNGTVVVETGTLNINLDNLTTSGKITNMYAGTLELIGGTLKNEITSNGTTVITSGSTVKMDGTYDLTSGQSLNITGTLDMIQDIGTTETYGELAVNGNLIVGSGGTINFGIDLSGVNITSGTTADLDAAYHDSIAVNGKASGTLNLGSVALKPQDNLTKMKVHDTVYFKLVNAKSYDTAFVIGTGTTVTSDIYKYTFTDASTVSGKGKGWVQVLKDYGFTLAEIVRGKGKDDKGAQVTNWSMVADTDLAATDADQYKYKDGSSEKSGIDLGTLVARTGSVTTAVLTISGNGKKLKGGVTTAGATRNGITVDSSGTLNIENLAEVSDFTDYFVTNKGTLNFKGDTSTTPATAVTTILKSAIKGDGTMNLSDKVTVDASATSIMQKKVTLVAETKLIADADNLTVTDGITNGGTVELTDGTLASGSTDAYNKISGGNISVAGDVIANASKLAGAITINDGKTLTLNGGAISGNIGVNTTSPSIGTGALKMVTGDVTNTANKTINAKILTIASGSLSTEVDTLIVTGGSITNNGTLTLTGDGTTDTLDENIGVTDGNITSVINFEGNIKVASNKSIKAGSVINVAADKTLTVDTVGILSNITNKDGDTYGTVKLENTTASSAFLAKKITNGTVVVNGDVTTDAGNLATTKGITISSDKTLTLTGGKISDTIDGGTTGKMTITTGAVTHADGKIITVKTLTVTSGSLTVDPDDLVITTGIVNNANGGLVFNADGELGATEGITGTGTTVINGGTLTAGTAIVQDVTLIKSTDKLIIAANNLQGDVTNAGTVELAAGTGAQTMTKTINGGNIIIAGETTSDLAKLGGAITNNSTLNASGILNKNISGTSGITKINGTLTANNSTARTIEGTLNLNSKTLDMQGNSLNTLNVGTLTGTGNIKFDAALDGTTASADRIIANTSTGTLNLESVNVTGSTTLSVGGSITDIDFATSGTTVSGAAYTGTSDGYLYKFEKDATNDYNLQVTKLYGYNLAQMIQNNCEAGDTVNPNVLSTFSMAANTDLSAKNVTVRTAAGTAYGSQVSHYAVWNNTGTPSLSDGTGLGTLAARSTATDPFTINGNSHTLNGGSKDGITVSSALVLNLTNISSIDNFSNCFVDNSAGTVNISAAAITGAEVGTVSGTMILNSKLMGAGAYNLLDGTLKVDDTANLAMTGTYGLNNSGILKLGSGNLKTKITGTGSTEILGTIDAESNSIAQSAMTIESGAELAVNTNNLNISSSSGAGTVINNGHLILNAAGTLEENVSGIGYITVIGDVVANGIIDNKTNTGTNDKGVVVTSGKLKINASNLQTVTENNAAVELSGGTLASGNTIKGGAISVIGTTEASADDLASDSSITNTSNLILNGGTLQDNITGAGTTTIKAGSVVKMDGSKSLSSGQNLTINGVLDMKEAVGTTENYKALNVAGALTAGGNSKINFGVKLDSGLTTGGNLSTTDYDRIVVGGAASGTLNLGSISVSANDSLTAGDTVYFQLVSSAANNITVDGTVSTTIGLFNYVFSDASAEKSAGWVKVVKGLGFTLAEIVRGKGENDKGATGATVTNWSLSKNTNLDASGESQYKYKEGTETVAVTDIGTLVGRSGTGAVELTINGNGFELSGGNGDKNGITVPVGGTVNVENLSKVSGFDEYFIKNLGTLNFRGDTSSIPATTATTTLQSAVTGSGNMYLQDSVIVDATDDNAKITQNTINIAAGTKLIIKDDMNLSITNGITNNGIVEVSGTGIGGTYGSNTGDTRNRIIGGTTNITGIVNAVGNSLTSTDVVVTSTGILNIAAGTTTNLTADAGTANITVDFTGSSADDYSKLGILSTKNNGVINILGGVITEEINSHVGVGQVTICEGTTYRGLAGTIFEEGDTTGATVGNLLAVSKINFDGGVFEFNNPTYSVDYLISARNKFEAESINAQIKATGNVIGVLTTVEASQLGEGVEMPKAVVLGKEVNTLVGTTSTTDIQVDGITGNMEDKRANGFNIDKLDLKAGSSGLAITNGKKVVIGGNGHDGNLITVDGATQNVNVVVGTKTTVAGATENKGTLGIGIVGSIASQGYKLQGNIKVNAESKVEVNGNAEITGGFDLDDSSIEVADGKKFTANTLTAGSTGGTIKESNILGTVNVKDTMTVSQTASSQLVTINVGTTTGGQGTLSVKTLDLGGNIIFVDPAWVPGVGVEGASEVATETTTLNGTYVAGQNSIVAFGTTDANAARSMFNDTKLTWGPDNVTAAAYVAQPINVANGSLRVDGSLTASPGAGLNGTVIFEARSLLMVNGNICQSTPAISGVTALTINTTAGKGSKLYVANVSPGTVYRIVNGVTDLAKAWSLDSVLCGLNTKVDTISLDGDVYTVTFKGSSYNFGDTLIPAVATAMTKAEDGNPAKDFMASIVDYGTLVSREGMVQAINALAKMNANMGVSHGQYTVSNITEDSVSEHLSIQNGRLGKEIWAKALHTKENVDGLDLVASEAYKGQYNGTIVGADLVRTDKFTMGAALTYVKGDVNTNSASKNETKHTGITVYGRQTLPNDEAVSFDLSFLHGTNDMRLHTAAINSTVTGDQNVNSFSLGGRWEKKIAVGKNSSILPHAGLRWLHMRNSAFTNSLGMHYDGVNTNTFILPVGIGIKAGMQSGSWRMSVKGDLGYQLNMGNKDQNQTVSFREGVNSFDVTFVDRSSWYASAGVEFAKKNFTAGIGYRYAKSSGTRQNRWDLNLSWAF